MVALWLLLVAVRRVATVPLGEMREVDETWAGAPLRRMVVTRGCPAFMDVGAAVRVFVAVPSAAHYGHRRQWARSTWCSQRPGDASMAVKFFVGTEPGTGVDSPDVVAEADRYGDLVVVPSWDGQDNVTAKQINAMRYFALLHGDTISERGLDASPSISAAGALPEPTHFMRVEDDVYPFLPTIARELASNTILAFPGPTVSSSGPFARFPRPSFHFRSFVPSFLRSFVR